MDVNKINWKIFNLAAGLSGVTLFVFNILRGVDIDLPIYVRLILEGFIVGYTVGLSIIHLFLED